MWFDNTGALFLPPSDVCVKSFLHLFYTLIEFYYTKAVSDQVSSPAPDWILLLWRPRIPASFVVQQQPFILGLVRDSSGQGKSLPSPSEHFFCCPLLTLQCTRVDEWLALCETSEEPCSAVPWWPHTAHGRNLSWVYTNLSVGFPGGSDGKASAYNVGDPGSIPGSGRSPAEGKGDPLQYPCLENPTDGGAW